MVELLNATEDEEARCDPFRPPPLGA